MRHASALGGGWAPPDLPTHTIMLELSLSGVPHLLVLKSSADHWSTSLSVVATENVMSMVEADWVQLLIVGDCAP
eukprot:COSAG02_NODE_62367_length_266_cov_0.616766_1_plen_74_part_01